MREQNTGHILQTALGDKKILIDFGIFLNM